ncbi:hypothetical protein EI94DRAFT_1613847, partial [Lactarius quietus]
HCLLSLRLSGESLDKRTLTAPGLRRRMQMVYQAHTPNATSMLHGVKELVYVRLKTCPQARFARFGQWRAERKALHWFVVVRILSHDVRLRS